MWTDFLIFGTLWFWIFSIITFVLITWAIEAAVYDTSDRGGGALATLILGIALVVYFFLGSNQHIVAMLTWAKENPLTIFFYVAGYYVAGVAWAIAKWYVYLKFKAADLKERIARQYISVSSLTDYKNMIPNATNNKARIISWMSYWPFSLFWTTLNKFFLRIWEYLYLQFEGVFNKMSNSAFSDVAQEIESKINAEKEKEKEKEKERDNKRSRSLTEN